MKDKVFHGGIQSNSVAWGWGRSGRASPKRAMSAPAGQTQLRNQQHLQRFRQRGATEGLDPHGKWELPGDEGAKVSDAARQQLERLREAAAARADNRNLVDDNMRGIQIRGPVKS
jgi:hypothetical protein